MNVELTIQEMFDDHPTLFKERADCLNHLFCTIGNGYEWYNGELVSDSIPLSDTEIKALENRLVDNKAFQHNKMSLRAESQYYYDQAKAKNFKNIPERHRQNYIKNAPANIAELPDDIYHKQPERRKRWYFYINIPNREYIDYCEDYAYLFNFPEDIKPDWHDAINECRKLLIEDGFDLPK